MGILLVISLKSDPCSSLLVVRASIPRCLSCPKCNFPNMLGSGGKGRRLSIRQPRFG
nr:MAG TPA: hypothetical protein [Caudoviricetes sp.]